MKFERTERRRARKDYACQVCRKPIPAGAHYRYTIFMTDDDDRPQVFREHPGRCWEDE